MKFLQVHTFYPHYLEQFYGDRPALKTAPYQQQLDTILQDGFGALHLFAPYMNELGYESQLIIANANLLQMQWLKEHHTAQISDKNWIKEVLLLQINAIQPDILYLSDPITFGSSFIRMLKKKPKLILGWRAARIPEKTDWSEFDVMLSNWTGCWKLAPRLGAKCVEYLLPGFPPFIAAATKDIQPTVDVVFCGQWTSQHQKRNAVLQELARYASETMPQLSLAYHLFCGEPETLPSEIKPYCMPPVWGMEMHRVLKRGKIALNATIDMAGGEGPNMREFEATGTGTFLLTQDYSNISQFFEPGRELVTFRSVDDLIEKIKFYLVHSDARQSIAMQGHQRCLDDHSILNRVQDLDEIIHRHLRQKHDEQRKLRKLRKQNLKLRRELELARDEIHAMQNSKLGRLREQWSKLKSQLSRVSANNNRINIR